MFVRSSKERPKTTQSMGKTRRSAFRLARGECEDWVAGKMWDVHDGSLLLRGPVLLWGSGIVLRRGACESLFEVADIVLFVHDMSKPYL